MKTLEMHEECNHCFYCDMPLSKRHEHDHFPVPQRFEGNQTVATCINCHDLKDRLLLRDWSVDDLWVAIKDMPPIARIFIAKAYPLILEAHLRIKKIGPMKNKPDDLLPSPLARLFQNVIPDMCH